MQRQAGSKDRIKCDQGIQLDIGMCGLSLVLAIKAIDFNTSWAIERITKDLTDLMLFPEPERNHMFSVIKSCLDQRDRENLSIHKERFQAFIMDGTVIPLPVDAVKPKITSPFQPIGHSNYVQLCLAL